MAEKFVIFEDAAKELKMSTNELKKLSDEGKIRSFMDSGKVKFRRSDLDALKTSMGITDVDDELTLAPPEDVPPVPPPASGPGGDEEVPPPPAATPTYKDEEFSIEPLDDEPKKGPLTPAAAAAAKKAESAAAAPAGEEEVASLSDFEITAGAEEQGQELSGEEAELLAMQGSVRGYEEAKAGNVGMTVVLVAAVVVMAFGVVVLMSFPADINPFTSLTDFFNK